MAPCQTTGAGLKKGRANAKLVREISVAAKMGGPDPAANPRLYAAIEKAKKESVNREAIERAIKKGAASAPKSSSSNTSSSRATPRTKCP